MQPFAGGRPGENDYALILCVIGAGSGVSGSGAETRAGAFLGWLTAAEGGGLPGNHVHALIGAERTIGRASLWQMLNELVPNLEARLEDGGTIGRRCYLYMSGKAIDLGNEIRLVARDESGRHLVLDASFQRFVSHLRTSRMFEQVVAIADVGLPTIDVQSIQMPVFPSSEPVPRGAPSDAFTALSAVVERPRETMSELAPVGSTSLGMTGAIIDGLSGGARDDPWTISASSLVSFVGTRLREEWGPSAQMPRYEYTATPPFIFSSATPKDELPPRLPNAHALIIGIEKYRVIPGLTTCAADARAIAAALTDPFIGGYSRENVRVLTNYSATRADVVNALAQISVADEAATVFIWFSGRASAENGEITLWCSDDDPRGADEYLLTASRLNGFLDRFVSRHVVFGLDVSEGAVGIASAPGRVILSATLPGEPAYESSTDAAGDFGLRIQRALKGAAGSGDDLSVFDLFEYAHAEVVADGKQHPTIIRDASQSDFPIAKRPLTPEYESNVDEHGHAYDVHVLHSLASPRAEFVEKALLPALKNAGLRVAVSAPLETSPVGRVVNVDRGIALSKRSLILATPALESEFAYGVVIDAQYSATEPHAVVAVDLEKGVERVGVGLEWEPYDLTEAKTARHGSVQKLIERLTAPPRVLRPENRVGVPLVDVADDHDRAQRDAWLLSVADSETLLALTQPKEATVVSRSVALHSDDVVFVRDPSRPTRVVGLTRVARVLRPVAAATPTGGERRYVFAPLLKFQSPRSSKNLIAVASAERPAGGAALLQLQNARALASFCVAANPESADMIAEWMGASVSGLVLDTCIAALRVQAEERDVLLPALLPHVDQSAVAELVRVARSRSDPITRGGTTRALIRHLRVARPGDLPLVANMLRDDPEPSARALVAAISPTAFPSLPLDYACYFDVTEDPERLSRLSDALRRELAEWRAEPMRVLDANIGDASDSDADMRRSACIILAWAHGFPHARAVRRRFLAGAIEAERAARFGRSGGRDGPPTFVMLDMRRTRVDEPWRRSIDVSGLAEASDADVERIVAELLDVVLTDVQLLTEAPPPPEPRSRGEALDAIVLEFGDLLETDADAIVVPVGITPAMMGAIGVQLVERVGEQVLANLAGRDALVAGETIVESTNGRIPAKHIIHVCVESAPAEHTADSAGRGASGAMLAADGLPDVDVVAFPALASGAGRLDPVDVARSVLPAIALRLERGSYIKTVKLVFRDREIMAAYDRVFAELQTANQLSTEPASNARRWFVSLRQATAGAVLVGGEVSIAIGFSSEEAPDAIPLLVPFSAFELTIYVDSTAAFHLTSPSQLTVQVTDGNIDVATLPLKLVALTGGTHTIRVAVNARGRSITTAEAVVSCDVRVDAAIALPDIPELIDRRTIPPPEPDVLLYVAFEEAKTTERIRLHITSAALGLDRHRLEEALPIDKAGVAAIQFAAAAAASGADETSPTDSLAAMRSLGAALYDVLMPDGHELRDIVARLFEVPQRAGRPLTWLVVSDEAASLPWELVCAHGDDENGHWFDDFFAARFSVAHWIGRRGFELANEAPLGPIGIVHYGQQGEARTRWRDALGSDTASDADRALGLDILRRGSPYFGVHLLRFSNAAETGEIVEAGTRGAAEDAATSLVGERRLDFTLRRPIVALSFVDAALDMGGPTAARNTNVERAWAIPFLLARVTAVVGPRWTTSPESDRVFFRAFYDAVRADKPLGLAVWEARDRLRAARPDRADWLAYSYFGHPACEPYPVEPAEGFTLFEPVGMHEDSAFVAGRTYNFRASLRGEAPAWYDGRRRGRATKPLSDGVRVLVAPLHDTEPRTYDLNPASGENDGESDDCYRIIPITMPDEPMTLNVFVQFTRGNQELRSSVVTLEVTDDESELLEVRE